MQDCVYHCAYACRCHGFCASFMHVRMKMMSRVCGSDKPIGAPARQEFWNSAPPVIGVIAPLHFSYKVPPRIHRLF
jgi:hypothetical protein